MTTVNRPNKLGITRVTPEKTASPLKQPEKVEYDDLDDANEPENIIISLLREHDRKGDVEFRVQNRIYVLCYQLDNKPVYFDKDIVMKHMENLSPVQELYVLPSH